MNSSVFRRAAPYVVLWLLVAVAIPIFFNAGWFSQSPAVSIYTGPLGFSGESALVDLQALATGYPGRSTGTRADRTSAQWVQKRFFDMGLNARIEEFACLSREPSVRQDQVMGLPVSSLTYTTTGYNVVATSPGQSEESLVIGAHRDVKGNTRGAEDNASGTASLLELARVLCATEHQYTYIFVSYDGEEEGLRGSSSFAATNADLPVELSISLDMTGFNEATTVGFYPFVSRRSASPLWTVTLARALSAANSLDVFQYGASEESSLNPVVTFWRVRKERLEARVPTDTEPFVDRGIPSLGLMAVQMAGERGRLAAIHGPIDTTDQVSAATLEMTGRFVEQYVRSLPLNNFSGSAKSRLYFISEDRLLAPQALAGFTAYVCALVAAALGLSWRDSAGRYGFAHFAAFLRAEGLWIGLTLAAAAVSAAFPAVVRSALANSFTIVTFNVAWGVFSLLGIAAVAYFRQRVLNRGNYSYHEVTSSQKALLNLSYALSFAALLLLVGPFAAVDAAIFPILVLGRINFRSQDSRVLWSVATLVWIAYSIFGMRARVSNAAFNPVTARLLAADFVKIASWMLTATFLFTSPRRGALAEDASG